MTVRTRIVGGPPDRQAYRPLQRSGPEPYVTRTELGSLPDGVADAEVLATITHLSDLHVCDVQSPTRVEFLDRLADPDSSIRDLVGEVGTYRAQDMLTTQVLAATVYAANRVLHGPGLGGQVDVAIMTGDNTDNGQANELEWYLTLLDGGSIVPDSGDHTRFDGVAVDGDERYWQPETVMGDLAQRRHGFPSVPGLLSAVRRPVSSPGLQMPWLAVHGNHDQLVQGTVPSDDLAAHVVGSSKPVRLAREPDDTGLLNLLQGLANCEPAALAQLAGAQTRPVPSDPARRFLRRREFVTAHHRASARPTGHGFAVGGPAYYRHDLGIVTVLVLDTVDEFGGWQGSLDRAQFDWLRSELADADAEHRYVVLASHHSLDTLVNPINARGAPQRVLGPELDCLLARHSCVTLWLNGHTHTTRATPRSGYWELTAPSLIDWPQQGRVVELARHAGTLVVVTTMLDHEGLTPWDGSIDSTAALAGLSRELAANDWQSPTGPPEDHPRAGTSSDRDLILTLPDPWTGARSWRRSASGATTTPSFTALRGT